MPVIWLIQVQDAMQESLGAADPGRTALDALLANVAALLEFTFPTAENIVVVDRLGGYSNSPDKHVLRVELIEGGASSSRIVKIGQRKLLCREWAGWVSCQRPSNDRGRAFMTLLPGKLADDGSKDVETLVYEDAQQTLRAAKVISLEQAVIECCQWGTPSASSLLGVFDQVFAEMVDRLYRRSWSRIPDAGLCQAFTGRLAPGRVKWNNPAALHGQCRETVITQLLGNAAAFIDPVSFADQALADPGKVPEMRFGCAHGDLNGRNVLVGAIDGEARCPAVFDYEDMANDISLGWDFAKLETELKIRAFQKVFPGDEHRFIERVYAFEERLAQETERLNNLHFQNWKESLDHGSDEQRLFSLLLGLRRQAKKSLEVIHGRSRTWLHEYYFLLACYGVYAGRHAAYFRPDIIATCVSAGFAAARYAWAQTNLLLPEHVALAEARRALTAPDSAARVTVPTALYYGPEFVFAREFVRSREVDFVVAGIAILEDLKLRHEMALEIWQELALAHFELFDLTGREEHRGRSQRALIDLDVRYPRPHYETLCRWGRLWKDRGDKEFDADPNSPGAATCYRESLKRYEEAYQRDQNYYPGINVVTLSLLLGDGGRADVLAKTILAQIDGLPRDSTPETVWRLATAAEAHLVLGNGKQAATLYHSAIAHSKCQAHNRQAMHKQVQRILRIRPCLEVDFDEVFNVT